MPPSHTRNLGKDRIFHIGRGQQSCVATLRHVTPRGRMIALPSHRPERELVRVAHVLEIDFVGAGRQRRLQWPGRKLDGMPHLKRVIRCAGAVTDKIDAVGIIKQAHVGKTGRTPALRPTQQDRRLAFINVRGPYTLPRSTAQRRCDAPNWASTCESGDARLRPVWLAHRQPSAHGRGAVRWHG